MKIISLQVQSFGKLKRVNLNFNDGINVINNVNGFGKTTMAGFIRAMLYGLSYSKTKGVSDVTRFQPWDADGKFGGSMVVEHNGEQLRIERFFGTASRQETLSVVNVKTNKQVELLPSAGEALLGLTVESYDRSAYFPQESVELLSNDNLENRLANLVENSAEDYDKVQKNIRDYRRNLRLERGNGGEIYNLECRSRELQTELHNAQNAERRNAEIERRLSAISGEQQEIARNQSSDAKKSDVLRKQLAQTALTDTEMETVRKVNGLQGKLARVPGEIEQDKAHLDDLTDKMRNLRDDVRPKVYPNKQILIISVIAAILGLAALVAGACIPQMICAIVGGAVLLLGVVGAVLAFVRRGAKTLVAGERDALITEYFGVASKYFYVKDLDFNQAVKRFDEYYREYLGDKREMDVLKSVVKKPVDTSELENEIASCEERISTANSRVTSLAAERGRLEEERKHLSFDSITPQEQLLAVTEQIACAKRRYEVAGIVSDLLMQAKDNLSSSYLPRLRARCQELLRQVMNNTYEVVIDRRFNVKIRENGQTKAMNDFSRGTREIVLLCFRLALSELLYEGAAPFVIIDDAFVNYDEDNFVRATNLLKKVAEHGQIIYFTCHKRMGNLLK